MNKCNNKPTLFVVKIDQQTKKGLGGAVFELRCPCGGSTSHTTPEYGLLRLKLDYCKKYLLKEAIAPSGYERSKKTYEIFVDRCGSIFVDGKCSDLIIVKNAPVVTTVTIKYLANGGSGEYSESGLPLLTQHEIKTLDETAIIPPEGSGFAQWNTMPDGSGTAYNPHDILVLTKNTTLYAQWSAVRSVMGLVYPIAFDDHGLGDDFIKGFEATVELRKTFLTPAPDGLKTTVSILYPEELIGRFLFHDVPLGDYVLCIKMAGYVVRCMNVSIAADSPEPVLLTPPTGTLFTLWAGDANNDMTINSQDTEIINQLQGIAYGQAGYIAAADLNFDGVIDAADTALATANLGKSAPDYIGAEDVDFNS